MVAASLAVERGLPARCAAKLAALHGKGEIPSKGKAGVGWWVVGVWVVDA